MKKRNDASSIKRQVDELKWRAVIDTAINLFYENGYAGTSIDMIAAHLGVTKPFIYYRFSSKSDLLTEVFAQAEEHVVSETVDILKSRMSPAQKYQLIVRNFAKVACEHWKLMAVFFTEERHLPEEKLAHHKQFLGEWERNVSSLLERGKKSGDFQFGDTKVTVNALVGMVIWLYTWIEDVPEGQREKVVDELTDLALALVRCSPVSPPS